MLRLAFFLSIFLMSGGSGRAAEAVPAVAVEESMENYALAAGDKLKITIFNVTEITGEYAISPTGKVALPLIGDIKAAGSTTETLSETIRARLAAGFINDPNVTVEVISFRPFYILGEVNRPGEIPFAANMTVEQAIAAAGGYTYRAARRRAFLRRVGGPERLVKFGTKPVYVMPGDTIRITQRFL